MNQKPNFEEEFKNFSPYRIILLYYCIQILLGIVLGLGRRFGLPDLLLIFVAFVGGFGGFVWIPVSFSWIEPPVREDLQKRFHIKIYRRIVVIKRGIWFSRKKAPFKEKLFVDFLGCGFVIFGFIGPVIAFIFFAIILS